MPILWAPHVMDAYVAGASCCGHLMLWVPHVMGALAGSPCRAGDRAPLVAPPSRGSHPEVVLVVWSNTSGNVL